ncbi:MAG: DUF4126 domain-containing protein [Microthrixaceae bacterium]
MHPGRSLRRGLAVPGRVELTEFTNLLGAIGLGSASGLNPWIPLFGLGLADRFGLVSLTGSSDLLSSTPALVVLGVLFLLDLVGDKIPAIDHGLHLVGLVVAPVSGAVVVAAQENLLSTSHPWLAAGVGFLLGGSFHVLRSAARPAVTLGTGGTGNFVVSAIEDAVSLTLTVLAVLVPVLAFLAVVGLAIGGVVLVRRWRRRRAARRAPGPLSAG